MSVAHQNQIYHHQLTTTFVSAKGGNNTVKLTQALCHGANAVVQTMMVTLYC